MGEEGEVEKRLLFDRAWKSCRTFLLQVVPAVALLLRSGDEWLYYSYGMASLPLTFFSRASLMTAEWLRGLHGFFVRVSPSNDLFIPKKR